MIQVSRPDPVSRPGPAAVGSAAGRESCFDGSGRALGEQLWQRVLQGLKRRRKRTFLVYAEMARVADCQDRELLLAVNSSFEKERLEDPAFKTLIQDILKETTGEAVRLQVVQQEGEITLHKFRVPAPAPAEPAPVPPPPPAEDIPLPDEPPADVAPSLPSGRQEPQPAAAAANPAPEPVKQGELPEGVKKAMQVFGGEVYKE